jgi:ribonuclease P protein component
MARTGGRKSRPEAIARSRSGSLLMLCLEINRSPRALAEPTHVLEVAIVTSKKQVSKLATERNRLRRRLRHAAQVLKGEQCADALQLDEDLMIKIILVSHREMQKSSFEELQMQILGAFKKLLSELSKSKRI